MPRFKIVDDKRIQLTEAEEAARDAEETNWEDGSFDRAIEDLRNKRNKKLVDTDYLALSDNTMSEAMTTYRQELRDATNGLETVEDVEAYEFPTKPE